MGIRNTVSKLAHKSLNRGNHILMVVISVHTKAPTTITYRKTKDKQEHLQTGILTAALTGTTPEAFTRGNMQFLGMPFAQGSMQCPSNSRKSKQVSDKDISNPFKLQQGPSRHGSLFKTHVQSSSCCSRNLNSPPAVPVDKEAPLTRAQSFASPHRDGSKSKYG